MSKVEPESFGHAAESGCPPAPPGPPTGGDSLHGVRWLPPNRHGESVDSDGLIGCQLDGFYNY